MGTFKNVFPAFPNSRFHFGRLQRMTAALAWICVSLTGVTLSAVSAEKEAETSARLTQKIEAEDGKAGAPSEEWDLRQTDKALDRIFGTPLSSSIPDKRQDAKCEAKSKSPRRAKKSLPIEIGGDIRIMGYMGRGIHRGFDRCGSARARIHATYKGRRFGFRGVTVKAIGRTRWQN